MKTQPDNPIASNVTKLSPIQWFDDHQFAVTVKAVFGTTDSRRPTNAKNKKQGVAAAAALICRGTRGFRPHRNPLVDLFTKYDWS
jgi:hypothetical protein